MVTAYGLSGVGDGDGDMLGVGDKVGVSDGVADNAGVAERTGVGEPSDVRGSVGVDDEPGAVPVGVGVAPGVGDGVGEAEAVAVGVGVEAVGVAGGGVSPPSCDSVVPSGNKTASSAKAGPEAQANNITAANSTAIQRFRIPLPSRSKLAIPGGSRARGPHLQISSIWYHIQLIDSNRFQRIHIFFKRLPNPPDFSDPAGLIYSS